MTVKYPAARLLEPAHQVPLVLRNPAAVELTPRGRVANYLDAGGRVVLLDVGIDAVGLLGWAGVHGAVLPPVASDNPLVRAESVTAVGRGLWADLQLSLTDLIELDGQPLAQAAGRTVVAHYAVGAGQLVVLPGQWTDRPDAADNAFGDPSRNDRDRRVRSGKARAAASGSARVPLTVATG